MAIVTAPSGNLTTVDAVIAVNPDGSALNIPSITSTGLGKAEDAPAVSGDTGVMFLAVRTPVTPTAQTNNDNDYGAPAIDQYGDVKTLAVDSTGTPLTYLASVNNGVPVSQTPASTGTKASVAASGTSITILALNLNRKSAKIVNDSTAILYLDATGGTASSSSYTDFVPGSVSGVPSTLTINNFTGLLTGIWASATGNARVSEYV